MIDLPFLPTYAERPGKLIAINTFAQIESLCRLIDGVQLFCKQRLNDGVYITANFATNAFCLKRRDSTKFSVKDSLPNSCMSFMCFPRLS